MSAMTKVGVVGCGGIGRVHLRQYRKMMDVELSVYDVQRAAVEQASAEFDAHPCPDLATLIARSDVVDVCVPTDLHREIGLQVIAQGRALLMEKPMARTVADALHLAEAADKAQVPMMPAQVVRFFPEFEAAKRLIEKGRIGLPAAARTRRGGRAPSGVNGWFQDVARSGGVLLDLAIHDFDWLRWTLGEVALVYARSARTEATRSGVEPEWTGDYALTTLTFEQGAIAHVEATWMDPSGFRTTFEVCGSEGMIEFDSRTSASLRTHTNQGSTLEGPLAPTDDPYYREIRGFLDAVRGNESPPVSPLDGVWAVSLAEAAVQSAVEGRAVEPQRV
jgi:predicted dehydrogenase